MSEGLGWAPDAGCPSSLEKWVNLPGKSLLKDFLGLSERLSPPKSWDGCDVSVVFPARGSWRVFGVRIQVAWG